jgi:hypothetical protein
MALTSSASGSSSPFSHHAPPRPLAATVTSCSLLIIRRYSAVSTSSRGVLARYKRLFAMFHPHLDFTALRQSIKRAPRAPVWEMRGARDALARCGATALHLQKWLDYACGTPDLSRHSHHLRIRRMYCLLRTWLDTAHALIRLRVRTRF